MSKLSRDERSKAMEGLAGWSPAKGRDAIEKTFKFRDFKDAFAFMERVAEKAEEADHHPEWFNVYNRVDVTLTTHDAGGLTRKDIDLARAMDRIAGDIQGA